MNPPDALHVLRRGTHLSLDDGACLMELVSVLAGQPLTDQPLCTDPTLATIARVVNDESSDTARQALSPLAVALIGRTGDRHRLAPAMVHACLTTVAAHLPHLPRALRRHLRRAEHRLPAGHSSDRPTRRRLLPAWLYTHGPAQHAITAMALALRELPDQHRDHVLRAVLDAAVAAAPPPKSTTPNRALRAAACDG